jgi:hydrogenase maturation protease
VTERASVLLLGIGNILWADEGFGVRCVEAFGAAFADHPDVRLLDGGTQGLYLTGDITHADRLVVFDAVDFGLAPGEMVIKRNGEVPAFMGAKPMSLHQMGFNDVLAAAELLGGLPRDIVLIGVQPVELEDYGGSLTPPVRAQLQPAVAAARAVLAEWGIAVEPRRADDPAMSDPLAIDAYEAGRPPADIASRIGDDRLLTRLAPHVLAAE